MMSNIRTLFTPATFLLLFERINKKLNSGGFFSSRAQNASTNQCTHKITLF